MLRIASRLCAARCIAVCHLATRCNQLPPLVPHAACCATAGGAPSTTPCVLPALTRSAPRRRRGVVGTAAPRPGGSPRWSRTTSTPGSRRGGGRWEKSERVSAAAGVASHSGTFAEPPRCVCASLSSGQQLPYAFTMLQGVVQVL